MMQILFRIPVYTSFTPEGIPVYGFGMMLFIAFIVCTWLAGKRAVAKGIDAQIVHDLSVWIFVAGLLGARTLFLYEQKLTFTEFLMNFPASGMVASFSMVRFWEALSDFLPIGSWCLGQNALSPFWLSISSRLQLPWVLQLEELAA